MNSYVFINDVEIYKFKAKDYEISTAPLCSGNVSKNVSVDNMKKTGLSRCIHDFSVDDDTIGVDNVLDIHKYLMKKHDIKQRFDLLEKCFIGLYISFNWSLTSMANAFSLTTCKSLNNQSCVARLTLIDLNPDECN